VQYSLVPILRGGGQALFRVQWPSISTRSAAYRLRRFVAAAASVFVAELDQRTLEIDPCEAPHTVTTKRRHQGGNSSLGQWDDVHDEDACLRLSMWTLTGRWCPALSRADPASNAFCGARLRTFSAQQIPPVHPCDGKQRRFSSPTRPRLVPDSFPNDQPRDSLLSFKLHWVSRIESRP
jgi:hypothetical protein